MRLEVEPPLDGLELRVVEQQRLEPERAARAVLNPTAPELSMSLLRAMPNSQPAAFSPSPRNSAAPGEGCCKTSRRSGPRRSHAAAFY
jgi:hypothetical protein